MRRELVRKADLGAQMADEADEQDFERQANAASFTAVVWIGERIWQVHTRFILEVRRRRGSRASPVAAPFGHPHDGRGQACRE